MQNQITLLKKLISIASYVDIDQDINEKTLADFISTFLYKYLPWLKVTKQYIDSNRYNIIALASNAPNLIFISHMDTVKPTGNNMLTPQIIGNKMYGLGAIDMKAGIATLLSGLTEIKSKNIGLIFDCDEEYNFLGIRTLLKRYKFNPQLVVCPEPTNLRIVNGCRGVIELEYYLKGRSAHAAQPKLGINAIEKSVEVVKLLNNIICKKDIKELGTSTVNLSSLNGGISTNNSINYQANAVPNISYNLIDIRIANTLKASDIYKLLSKISRDLNIGIEKININLDYSYYITNKNKLKKVESIISNRIKGNAYVDNLGKGGFYEAAFVNQAWNCPAISFGPGNAETAHTNKEYVELDSLKQTKYIFKELINNIG